MHHDKDDARGAVDETFGAIEEATGGFTGNRHEVQQGRQEVQQGQHEEFIGHAKDDLHNVEDRVKGFFHHGQEQTPQATSHPQPAAGQDETALDEISRNINDNNR